MQEFFSKLFNTDDFPARWQCGNWSDGHGWLHIISDIAIFGAYLAIPMALLYFILRRRDIAITPVLWLFTAFILACGIGHLIEATIFWQPWYRLSGVSKAITATVSWATVIALIPWIPRILAMTSDNLRMRTQIEETEAEAIELRTRNEDLDRFAQLSMGREQRILELKDEVNDLLEKLGEQPRYGQTPPS